MIFISKNAKLHKNELIIMSTATASLKHTHTPSLSQEVASLGGEMVIEGLSDEQFYILAGRFPDLRMEKEKNGKIIIMAPIAGFGGARENRLGRRLGNWRDDINIGETFSPSTGFKLPDGTTTSPDASWVNDKKLNDLLKAQGEKGFLKVVPDFVAEICSENDKLDKVKAKMKDVWIANGVKLGWLIDPYNELAIIYRADGSTEEIKGFDNTLSGENVLPGFELKLEEFRLTGGR